MCRPKARRMSTCITRRLGGAGSRALGLRVGPERLTGACTGALDLRGMHIPGLLGPGITAGITAATEVVVTEAEATMAAGSEAAEAAVVGGR